MKFYVACEWAKREDAAVVMSNLEALGHEISYDWTVATYDGLTGDALQAAAEQFAEADYQGIMDADVFILLDSPGCKSAYTELGLAIALAKEVFVVFGQHNNRNIFFDLVEVGHFRNLDDMYAAFAGEDEEGELEG